jgi:hypothetical protein
MSDKIFPGDKMKAAMNYGAQGGDGAGAPYFVADVELVRDGQTIWKDKFANSVQQGGKVDLMNRYFGGTGGAWNTVWLGVHNRTDATFSTASRLSDVTGAEIGGYQYAGATGQRFSIAGVSSLATSNPASWTVTASFSFTQTLQTAAGLLLAMNTTGTIASLTRGTDGVIYSMGTFAGGSKPVANGDILNVTMTQSMQ